MTSQHILHAPTSVSFHGPLHFPDPCTFLSPHPGYKLFNFDIQCPHPSLEGRGSVVVVGDVIAMSVWAFLSGGKRYENRYDVSLGRRNIIETWTHLVFMLSRPLSTMKGSDGSWIWRTRVDCSLFGSCRATASVLDNFYPWHEAGTYFKICPMRFEGTSRRPRLKTYNKYWKVQGQCKESG